jgi:chromosome segregation ATPase
LQAEIYALQARCADHDGNTEQQAHRVSELNEELGRSRADAERARTELRELREALQDSTDQLSSRNNDVAVLESELLTTREQFNSLELELRDEKERADALTELANERLDRLSALHEDLEAADERVSELDWQLSRSRHLQALVARRKRLVSNLIGEIRAKKKSNEALKAGLDSLRIFKSAAEERQAKLTHRIEDLNERLAAAEENAHHARAAHSDEQGTAARVTDLQARLATQAELIESLEQEVVQLRRQLGSGAGADSADLETELAEKEQTIQRLAAAVKAREATISDLQNQVSGWQRKYEFLATPENPHDLGIPKKAAGGPSEP